MEKVTDKQSSHLHEFNSIQCLTFGHLLQCTNQWCQNKITELNHWRPALHDPVDLAEIMHCCWYVEYESGENQFWFRRVVSSVFGLMEQESCCIKSSPWSALNYVHCNRDHQGKICPCFQKLLYEISRLLVAAMVTMMTSKVINPF